MNRMIYYSSDFESGPYKRIFSKIFFQKKLTQRLSFAKKKYYRIITIHFINDYFFFIQQIQNKLERVCRVEDYCSVQITQIPVDINQLNSFEPEMLENIANQESNQLK